MIAADIYESAKEAILFLRQSRISDADHEALGVLLATLERLAADLLEAQLEIAAGLGKPEGGLPGWGWDTRNSRWARQLTDEIWAWTHRNAQEEDGWHWCVSPVWMGNADTPRKAMRAAEEVLRAGGLL